MKTILQAIAMVLLCTSLSLQAGAQSEISVDTPAFDLEFMLPKAGKDKIKAGPQQVSVIDQPLILKNPKTGKCYAFRCQAEDSCENCVLLWRDRNENERINPRTELRCRCQGDPEKSCKVRVQEVACEE